MTSAATLATMAASTGSQPPSISMSASQTQSTPMSASQMSTTQFSMTDDDALMISHISVVETQMGDIA